MSTRGAWHFMSSTDLYQDEKFQNVPLRKKSRSECLLDIDYHSDKESLQLLLLSPYSSTINSYRFHLTSLNLSESDLNIKSKKSNKMVFDNKTNDSLFNESTNVLTTKPKNKHKDKSHKEIRYCDAVNQSSFSKMDRAEGNPKASFQLKDDSEKYSHKKTHRHRKYHSENADTEKDLKKDKKIQIATNDEEDLMPYKRRKKFGVDKATDPVGYTANLIKNSQLCFVLSTGSNPFKSDNNNESVIKVKGALINGKDKRSRKKEDVDVQESNETLEKRPKSDGISFFFKKKKLFSRSPSVKDEEATKLEESNDKTTRRKSKQRDELKSASMGKEKRKHHSKNRSLSADATAHAYMDRESVESKSYVGDAFKILKRSKKHNVSLKSENIKREKIKTKSERSKKHSYETDGTDRHNKKSDNECDTAWYKIRRKTKTRSNSLSGFEEKKDEDKRKETKSKEKDVKSGTESIKKHHRSKKKRDKSKTNSLCVVTSDTQIFSCSNDREKLIENLKIRKKVASPNGSYHKIRKGSPEKKENEKLTKHQTDTSEKKQRKHHEYKQLAELEDIISRGAKEIHDELQHHDHHRAPHREHRHKSRNKSKHKSKSRDQSKNVQDITSKPKKVASDSNILNKSSTGEYVISNSDYAVILEKIVSGKHSFKELTSAIEENHFFEALKSGSLLTPKQSSNLKEVESKKSYAVTKKQLEILINYIKCSVDDKKANSLEILVSDDKLTESKLERQEISFSKLNLNPINQFQDRNCWDRFVPKNKRLKKRMPFDQHSIVSDAITAKEKNHHGNRCCQNRTPRNFSYSENITERSNRSVRSALGFTVEGVEPPKKLRPDVSCVNLTKSNKDGVEPHKPLSPDGSFVNLAKPTKKKPLQISVLSVLEIKPNFAEVFNKSNINFEYEIAAQPLEDMKEIKEEPERESKSILKKPSNTAESVTGKAVSNVAISRKTSNVSGSKLNIIPSAISQNKSRLSISESEKSVGLRSITSKPFQNSAQIQNSNTKFQVRSSNSLESRRKIQANSIDGVGNKYPEDNRKALGKYSLLSEKCSLSEPRNSEVLNRDLDKDQLANLGQEVLEMMKKYINLSKNEDCPNMDLSSFGAEFLTNVRTCIHERLKPVKEELDTETKESVLPRTDSKSLSMRPSSTSRKIREDISKCVQNYLDSNSVASLNQEDLSQITSNVTKKVESYINDSKKGKPPSHSKTKLTVSSKEGVRARMANYINTINEKRRGSSVSAIRSREHSLDRNSIRRTLSIISRDSSRGSINFKRNVNKQVSDKSLNDFSAARGSTSSGLSAISRDDSVTCSISKKVEDGNEVSPNAEDSDATVIVDKKSDLTTENVEGLELKCSISSVLLPKITEESPSQNSFGLNNSQKVGKQTKPVLKCSNKVTSKPSNSSAAKPKEDAKAAGISDPLKRISENKIRRRVSKNELNEKLKIIAQDMSDRVMKALKGSSDDGSLTMTGDDASSAGSQFSEVLANNFSAINNMIKASPKSDLTKPPIMKPLKAKTQATIEKYGSSASLHPKSESSPLLKTSKVALNKPIVKKKKKVSDSLSNFSHQGSEARLNLKKADLTPLKGIHDTNKAKLQNAEMANLNNNMQSTENVAMLNELISKNIMSILGKNSQLKINTPKEKTRKKEEVKRSAIKLVKNEGDDRKKKIIDKLAAAILDDKIFGNLEPQLSKLLDKQSDQVNLDSTKKVTVKEQTHERRAQVVKTELKKNIPTKLIKPVENNSNKDEILEPADPKKVLTAKVSKIPRYTRFGTKSTTSHFGTISDAGSNIGSVSRPTALPKPLKKTTNALRTEDPSTNYANRLPVSPILSTPKEEAAARPLSTFEKRKLYAANMRAKKFASKSEAEFTADECTHGKPYEVLYVTGEGPSVDPNCPLSKYIFDEPSGSKNTKKHECRVKKEEKISSCTKVKAELSTEVTIAFTPSNNKLNISSNLHKIEQNSEFQIRSENNFLRDCDNDSNIFRNNYARRASSVSLYSQESRFSQEICMHCLTPKAALSLVSIPTSYKEKLYSTRSNSILRIDGSDSSHEMVKKPRFNKKLRGPVFNETHFLGYNKEVLSAFLKTTEGSSNLSIKTSPGELLKSKTDLLIKRVKSCGGFTGVWKKNDSVETENFHYKKGNAPKSFSTFEEPHSSNHHPAAELKIKKKTNKLRKAMLVEVAESSICENLQEKHRKPKRKRNKRCLSAFSFQSSKCEYFQLHKPLINLTRAIKKQNQVLCAKVNKLKRSHKPKKNLCKCECDGSEEGCYTIFKNFHCSKVPRRYFSHENFQFFRCSSLTDLDTNYSTTSFQNSVDVEVPKQKYLPRVPSKNYSVNAESGYETHSSKTVNSIRRFYSAEENILSQFTTGFRNFDAGCTFPVVYTVFPVNVDNNQGKCCDKSVNNPEKLNRKPPSTCAKLRLKQVRSCDKGTSPKPDKVRFKKCVVESENNFCENHGTQNCNCKSCTGKPSRNESNDRPPVLVCRNPKCPKNIKAQMKRSDGKKSEDEFSITSCGNSNISQSDTSSRSSNSQFTPIDRQFSSSSTYSCGYSEPPELHIKQSGTIKSGCIPKYIWCKVKSRENSPTKSTCSCGTTYQTFQKEKEQCQEYAQKVRKESKLRKEGRFKQFSDFKEIPLCVLLNSSNECNTKDNCPKYNEKKSNDSPKLKVLDKDYDSTTSEVSCMRSRCPRNPSASQESPNVLNDETRDSILSDLMGVPKNLNNLSKESLIDIINGQFQSSLKNILDNPKERISVSSKEVSAQLIKPESSEMLKDTSVQAMAPFTDKSSDELNLTSNQDLDPHKDSIVNLVRQELERSINAFPSPGPSGSTLTKSEHIENKGSVRNAKQSDTCVTSTCQNRKASYTAPQTQVIEHSNSANISNVSSKKTPCSLKRTPSGKKEVNCHCLDFQKMPKSTLLKLKEQIDMCLTEANNQNESNMKPKMSKKSSFPFNANSVDNQFLANFMQAPVESSNLSRIPFSGLSASAPLYGKQFTDVNKVSIQGSSFSDDSSHTLFLESYWGRTENNVGTPEEIAKPLLLPRNIVSENLNYKGTIESFSSPEDIPSKEQSFKTPSKQQMLTNSYLEDARCDSNNKINNFSIPNMLNNTLKELEFINATKQSLELSSEKLSKQLKTLSIELLLQSTNQEDSNNSQYENVITMKEAIDTTFRHLLNSSKEALDVSSKEAQNQLMQSITELSIKSVSDNSLREHTPDVPKRPHKSSKFRSKESSEATLPPKTSLASGAIKKTKGSPKEGRRRTLKEPPTQSSTEVLTETNDKKTKVSSQKSITSTSSRCSQETNISQEIGTVQESVSIDDANSFRVEENCQTSDSTLPVTTETSTDPINSSKLANSSKAVDTQSSEVEEIVNFHTAQVMNFESITNENSSKTFSNQLSSDILTSNLSSEETVQENFRNFKDSLSSLMDLIEMKSDELLSMSQESLVISLDEITMMNESNLSSDDLSKKLGVLFKTSLVKLLDMKSDHLNELVLQETFRNTVQVLLNEIFDETLNQVLQSNVVAKTKNDLNLDLYRDMLCDFMKESDENPFEKPIDTISKVAIVMLVQNMSCAKPKRRNNPIPDELLLEMAKVSLHAIIELYQKMYSKKQVNVSFKVMVEDMCRNQSLNKKMKGNLTGSQLEIINILNKKYVSVSNTKNYKNCLCSPIKDIPSMPVAAPKHENIRITDSSKFTVKYTDKKKVGMAGSSKFSMKDKESDQQNTADELKKSKKQLTEEEKVKMAGSSKFAMIDKKPEQQNTVDELEKVGKQLTNEEEFRPMECSKFTLENQQPDQQTNVHALEKLREQLTDKEMFEKLLDSYEHEEKIVDRLSKDDIFFQSQLKLVKSKESVESMFKNGIKTSSSDFLHKEFSDSSSENFSKKFSIDSSTKAETAEINDQNYGITLVRPKTKSKDFSLRSQTSNQEPESISEKLLYKYDFEQMVSTHEGSQTVNKSSSIISKGESSKSQKLSSKSKLSGIKAKVGNMFRKESAIKEIVAPRAESNRPSLNESYLSKSKTAKESSDDDQKVKFGGDPKQETLKGASFQDDFFEINNYAAKVKGSISSMGSNKINPAELGKCFLRGFRPDNITLSGDTCLKISNQEEEERELKFQLYRSPSINFSERETPLDFLLALGFSIDEASNAIKDEDVKNRLLAAITEARIWINKITSVQGTLLYLIAYKAKPKIMRYFLQLVEAIINKRINDAVKLDAFLRVLEKVEDGDLAMIAILGSEKFADDDNDEKMVKKQLRKIFITVYKIAETESASRNKPLSLNAINLLRILAAKYRAGLHPHLELIAKYIGQDLLRSEVQLEAAMIYLARLDTAYVNLEEFEEYIAIKCPNKKG